MREHEHDPEDALRVRGATPERDPKRTVDGDADDTTRAGARAVIEGRPSAAPPTSVLHLQRTAGNAGVATSLQRDEEASPVKDVVGKGGGRALDEDTRATMEDHLGADFSDVRVHDDATASHSAEAVGAHAYTVGNEIVFQQGGFRPDSDDGRRTLAHELTHVVQQRSGPVDATPAGGGIALSDPSDRFEREAERTAERVASGQRADVGGATASAPANSVQRQADDEAVQALAVQRQEMEEEEQEESPSPPDEGETYEEDEAGE